MKERQEDGDHVAHWAALAFVPSQLIYGLLFFSPDLTKEKGADGCYWRTLNSVWLIFQCIQMSRGETP